MPREISSTTSLDNLRKEAKRWLRALRSGDPDARARFERAHPSIPARIGLRDVQHALAREHGLKDWTALKLALDRRGSSPRRGALALQNLDEYEQLAADLVAAFESRDDAALGRLNTRYQRSFTFDDLWAEIWRRVYAFRQRAFRGGGDHLEAAEAQVVIAQDAGFGSWAALTRAIQAGAAPVPPYEIDAAENTIA